MHATHYQALEDSLVIEEKLPYWKLFFLTVSFLGVQFGWAIQIAFTTPIFLQLGVPHFWISFVWLAGPISGLLVQPIVGVVSDSWNGSWGRRRPFILFGAIFIVVGLALISNAEYLGTLLGDDDKKESSKTFAIFIAVAGFWILDLSNNTVQGPCRALLVDVAPPSQQGLGSALFSFMLGIGNLFGYFTGHLQLTKWLPFMGTDIRALFTISMIFLAVCITLTITTTHEKPYHRPEGKLIENPFKQIYQGIRKMPPVVARVCVVQFFSWMGWYTYILFITDWMGEDVYKGNPTAIEGSPERELYEAGVRAGSLALTYNSIVTIACSVVLPKIIHYNLKATYFVGQILLSLFLLVTLAVSNSAGATALITMFGVPWAITMVIPFTIVGQGVTAKESGLYIGVLNIFVVLPQLVISAGIGIVIDIFGSITSALVTGGIFSLISAAFTFRILIPSINERQSVEEISTPIKPSDNQPNPNETNYGGVKTLGGDTDDNIKIPIMKDERNEVNDDSEKNEDNTSPINNVNSVQN